MSDSELEGLTEPRGTGLGGNPEQGHQAPDTSVQIESIPGLSVCSRRVFAGCYSGLNSKATKQGQTKTSPLVSGAFSPQPSQNCSKGATLIDFKLEISLEQDF